MALLQRAQAAHAAANSSTNHQQTNTALQQQQQQQQTHLQMPQQFVGVTGVYDIAKHYAYEKDRGVHSLSTMLPAMGGFDQFAANSPSVILAAALQQQQHAKGQHNPKQQQQQHASSNGAAVAAGGVQQAQEPPACGFYNSFSLSGESIAHRIGEALGRQAASLAQTQCVCCCSTDARVRTGSCVAPSTSPGY
jgi:hypothetical protein